MEEQGGKHEFYRLLYVFWNKNKCCAVQPQHYYRVCPLLWRIHFLLGHAKWLPLPDWSRMDRDFIVIISTFSHLDRHFLLQQEHKLHPKQLLRRSTELWVDRTHFRQETIEHMINFQNFSTKIDNNLFRNISQRYFSLDSKYFL